jgi:hypothetical protein
MATHAGPQRFSRATAAAPATGHVPAGLREPRRAGPGFEWRLGEPGVRQGQ